MAFYNYAAFSYDNKYFGYVGKPYSDGLIHLFKLDFSDYSADLDSKANKERLDIRFPDERWTPRKTPKALEDIIIKNSGDLNK